eukprot:GFUD01013604.1.p1 GENE.GFUD01013604.1~~GFUD01013604.1.p1  ORF type:complete len:435 (+),score=106.74 GFUD01013604.1:103-1407(+)
MASISSIDVDQNLSKCKVHYTAQNSFLQKLDKKTVLKASFCLLIAVTFILACRGVSAGNENEQTILELKESVDAVSDVKTELEIMISLKEVSSNKQMESIKSELERLSLSRHCPNRWVLFSGLCYYFSAKTETATWDEAKKTCKRMQKDSNLVMPKTQKENDYLKQVNNLTEGSAVHPDIWLGGSDIEDEGVWKWVDGSTIPQSLQDDNWALGEPNNAYGGTQHCLAKYFRGGRGTRNSRTDRFWDDAVCDAKKQFICSFDPKFDCPRGWTKYRDSCYYVSGVMAPWSEARSLCKTAQNSSDLVAFTDLDEASFVKGLIVDRSRYEEIIWVGASDLKREGDWRWVKGGSVGNSFWNSGEPNNIGGEHCAMINKSAKLKDSKCSKKFLFVCKMGSSEDGFQSVLTLGDHLGNMEKDIRDLKVNITNVNKMVENLQ